MTIDRLVEDKQIINDIDERMPYFRPMMNVYARHPTSGNEYAITQYLDMIKDRFSPRHYDAMNHIYKAIRDGKNEG